MSEANAAKLEKSIIDFGFSFSFNIWTDPQGQHHCLDGHQRRRVLCKMKDKGWIIPPLPVSWVEASSLNEAKKKVLAAAAQYGSVNTQGLYEFIETNSISLEFLEAAIELPTIDLGKFKAEYYTDLDIEKDPDTTRPDPKKLVTCPNCGHEF